MDQQNPASVVQRKKNSQGNAPGGLIYARDASPVHLAPSRFQETGVDFDRGPEKQRQKNGARRREQPRGDPRRTYGPQQRRTEWRGRKRRRQPVSIQPRHPIAGNGLPSPAPAKRDKDRKQHPPKGE